MNKEFIRDFPVKDLIPYERNPRVNKHAVESLAKAIQRVGNNDPIEVNEQNVILCGHTRKMALDKLGIKKTDIIVISGLTEDQQREYRITNNKTGEIADWDFDILEADFTHDQLYEFGFDLKDLTRPDVVEDEAPPVPETPRTVRGDIYTLGRHRVMCGDSTMIDDVELLLNGNRVRISVTSPPYYNQREYSTFGSYQEYLDFISNVIVNIKIVSMEDSVCVWNVGSSESTNDFIPADNYIQFKNAGFKWIEYIVWNKESATWTIPRSQHISNGLYIPALRWESIIIFLIGKRPHFDINDEKEVRTWQENVWNINKVIGSQQKLIGHTALFPVEIPYRAIKSYSQPLEVIFDPFCGGGSTLIACEKSGRIGYGMELDEKYCDVIVQRWVNFTGGQVILNGHPVEWSKTS